MGWFEEDLKFCFFEVVEDDIEINIFFFWLFNLIGFLFMFGLVILNEFVWGLLIVYCLRCFALLDIKKLLFVVKCNVVVIKEFDVVWVFISKVLFF